MPRPRKCRKVNTTPDVTYFKPRGVPLRELSEVYLPLDGFEAIRLADLEGLSHEKAALEMHVSRQTFGRILASAHQTVAKALVSGLALRIHGGDYSLEQSPADDGAQNDAMSPAGEEIEHADTQAPASINDQEENGLMKKIAISSQGPTLEDAVDPRFGRAAGFIIVDADTMDFEYLDNGASQARAQGAGIQAAESVVSSGAEVVLTGFVGPKAYQALAATGIRVAQNLDNLNVKEAIERYKKGEVDWVTSDQARGFGK